MKTMFVTLLGLAALLAIGQPVLAAESQAMKPMNEATKMEQPAAMQPDAKAMDKAGQKMDAGKAMDKAMDKAGQMKDGDKSMGKMK